MKRETIAFVRALRKLLLPQTQCSRRLGRTRPLQYQLLESRRVFTLPATQTFAEGDAVPYNGPTVDTVNDSLSFDAFIDFAGDVDSYFLAPQFSGTYTIDVGDFGNLVDPEVAIYVASTGAQVGYNDDVSEFNDDARIIVNLVADVRYIIAVADMPGTTAGNVSISVSAPFRTGSFLLIPDVFGDATAAVTLDVPTDIDYYSITAPADATGGLLISTTGSTVNHRLALFDSAGTLLQGPLVSLAYSSALPNQEYRVAVFSSNYATAGSLILQVDFAETGAIVTNTLDAGPGSLRQAILDANAHPNVPGLPDKIIFAIPGAGTQNIALASALPVITDPVSIDGATQPGTGATPLVAIDGSALVGAIDGLRIDASGSVVRSLNIRSFPSDGIEVRGSNVLIEKNTIGTDFGGLSALGNKEYGIRIQGGANNRIDSNVISGNVVGGMAMVGDTAVNNTIANNTIGAKFGGTVALPNTGHGIIVVDSDTNEFSRNVLSGNTYSGIFIMGSATGNKVVGNSIGTQISGSAALPNGSDGVVLLSSGNQIGGNQAALRNVISGNGRAGVFINGAGASNNVVEGNFIGTAINGATAIPNAGDGVRVDNAPNNRIGSATDAAARNIISGNTGSGVTFAQAGSSGGLVVGNYIGLAANGTAALGNSRDGVTLTTGATNVQIGGSTTLAQNYISANRANGISILVNSNNNRVSRNWIGTSVTSTALGNVGSGITIQSSGNTIGGADTNFKNVVAGNAQGITVTGATAINNTIAFNTIGIDTAPNFGRGIQFLTGASRNTVGPSNTIRRNETGILVNDGSVRNRITQNAIGSNFNLGIDLLPFSGVTANDANDADTGGNLLQNTPVISAAPLLIGSEVEVVFHVTSSPTNSAYPLRVEFFVSDGSGEGAKLIGSTIYTAANFATGDKTVSFVGAATGLTAGFSKIVGTATDLNGNTSEFSAQQTIVSGGVGLTAAAPSSAKSTSVNVAAPTNSTLAVSLINFINSSGAVDGNVRIASGDTKSAKYDVNGDRTVGAIDLLLLVRGLQKNNPSKPTTPSAQQLVDRAYWDSMLGYLDIDDFMAIDAALAKSAWIKRR